MERPEKSPVQRVQEVLQPHGLEVRELQADTSTAASAAESLGTTEGTIVKSLLFIAGSEPVLLLVSGDRSVDTTAVVRLTGSPHVRLARRREVFDITGFSVGGVSPVAHERPLRTLIDKHLMKHLTVYAAAGATNAVFAVAPEKLVILTGGEVCDLTS